MSRRSSTKIKKRDPLPQIRFYTGNGQGASSTALRKFTNVTVSDTAYAAGLSYDNDASQGSWFTVSQGGIYHVMYSDRSDVTIVTMAITRNVAFPMTTWAGNLLTWDKILAFCGAYGPEGDVQYLHYFGWLDGGDTIHAHCDPNMDGTDAAECQFQIVRMW